MAQQNQLVGIIELDAGPELDATLDENIGQTLRRLRSAAPAVAHREPDSLSYPSSVSGWDEVDDALQDSVVVFIADLRQLHSDLESELAKLLDRLLTF